MTLHMLFGCAQLENCLALLTANDTLMVIDYSALEALKACPATLPCDLVVLEEASSELLSHKGLALIDTAGWLELVCQYPHSMSWF